MAFLGIGNVIQTKYGSKLNAFSMTGTTMLNTGLTVSITSIGASSKFMIWCSLRSQIQGGVNKGNMMVLRSSLDSYASNLAGSLMINDWSTWDQDGGSIIYEHSPSQAASTGITYRIYMGDTRFGSSLYLNDTWSYPITGTYITIQEIGA